MAKYFTYAGKPVGFVRKMLDDVVMIEEAWTSAVNAYFAKNGYDNLLKIVAQILNSGGHPPVSRAQAWIILHDLTNKGVPDALRNAEADETSGKGKLFADTMKTVAVGAATVVDSTVSAGKTVGGGTISIASKPITAAKSRLGSSEEDLSEE